MPKNDKNIGQYDLTYRFKSSLNKEYSYDVDDSDNLLVWVKSDSTTDLVDSSDSSKTVSGETDLTSLQKISFRNQGYVQNFNSLTFNGSSSRYAISDADDLTFSKDGKDQPFSVSMWVRFEDFSQIHGLFGKSVNSSNREYYLASFTDGRLAMIIYDETNNAFVYKYSSVGTVTSDNWYNIVVTYDGSEDADGINIYVNGELTGIQTAAESVSYDSIVNTSSDLYVGFAFVTTTSRYFKGDIAEFALWSKELSLNTINAIYHRKGYDIYMSGIINNPTRVILKNRDNQLNTYPRVKQLNDVESSFTLSSFDDNNSIIYGKKIADDFNLEVNKPDQIKRQVNLKKWVVSENRSVIIRKEDMVNLPTIKPTPALPGALVLGGAARWIRTVDKVKNPHLRFKVIVRPYSFENGAAINLSGGVSNTNTLKVQISSDASSWEDVDIEARNISNPAVRVVSGGLDPTSPLLTIGLNGGNRRYLKQNADGFAKPEYEVNIGPDQLNLQSDHNASFYIRIIQETIDNVRNVTWALSEIEIISREQTTIGQTGLKRSNSYALTSSFATPNKLSNLTIQNSISLPHQSNNLFTLNEDNPSITAFNDSKHVYDDSKEFYQYGVSPKIYPGFNQRLSNKRVFEYDLSTSEETRLGTVNKDWVITSPSNGGSTQADVIQPLMCYWNKDLKRWETIGGIRSNLELGYNYDTQKACITSSMVPFSSFASIATGSGTTSVDTSLKLIDQKIIDTNLRPTDAFGFPFSGRYHATSSQYVLASDIGITRPILLEKFVIDYQLKHGYPWANLPSYSNNSSINNSTAFIFGQLSLHNINFFILRQRKDRCSTNINIERFEAYPNQNTDISFSYNESIPDYFDLDQDGVKETYVDDSRDLISYGQQIIFYSGSTGTDNSGGSITPNDIYDAYQNRESVFVSFGTSNSYTSSFSMECKTKLTSLYPKSTFLPFNSVSGSGQPDNIIYIDKQKDGRGNGDLASNSRAIVNGFGAFKKSKSSFEVKSPISIGSPALRSRIKNISAPENNNIDLVSPYIIYPNDKLIFGWAMPPSPNYTMSQVAWYDTYFSRDTTLGLFGNSKLRLYGSEIKDGREYHTGLNQNLTTNAIHTVIGDDPVVDQFQIATRGELSGSYADDFPIESDSSKVIFW